MKYASLLMVLLLSACVADIPAPSTHQHQHQNQHQDGDLYPDGCGA